MHTTALDNSLQANQTGILCVSQPAGDYIIDNIVASTTIIFLQLCMGIFFDVMNNISTCVIDLTTD